MGRRLLPNIHDELDDATFTTASVTVSVTLSSLNSKQRQRLPPRIVTVQKLDSAVDPSKFAAALIFSRQMIPKYQPYPD